MYKCMITLSALIETLRSRVSMQNAPMREFFAKFPASCKLEFNTCTICSKDRQIGEEI